MTVSIFPVNGELLSMTVFCFSLSCLFLLEYFVSILTLYDVVIYCFILVVSCSSQVLFSELSECGTRHGAGSFGSIRAFHRTTRLGKVVLLIWNCLLQDDSHKLFNMSKKSFHVKEDLVEYIRNPPPQMGTDRHDN